MKQKDKQPDLTTCENCGKKIKPGRGRRRLYCNQACKQAAYRKRKGK